MDVSGTPNLESWILACEFVTALALFWENVFGNWSRLSVKAEAKCGVITVVNFLQQASDFRDFSLIEKPLAIVSNLSASLFRRGCEFD